MNINLNYRELHSGEEEKVCELVMDCFDEFIAPEYSQDGIEEFRNYVYPDALGHRLRNTDNFAILAMDEEQVVGVIEVRAYNYISLLFVRKEYHKKGIAKRLIQQAIERCKQYNPSLKMININSSPYTVEIYRRMGFIQTDKEQVLNGIRFIPMECPYTQQKLNKDLLPIIGGLELLPQVKTLWEGLREHHSNISKNFSQSIRKRSFEDRVADFEGKASNHIFRIELIKIYATRSHIGYCISSLSNELVGEIESIFIEEDYRGLHIGDMLMKNALNWMDEHNAKTKRISVMAGNNVLKFYEKYGFKVRSHILEIID